MTETDGADCAAKLRCGSRSFHAASRLLPARVRHAATGLYAFCRVADDEIDEAGANQAKALAALYTRLDAIYGGTPQNFPEDRAFTTVVRDHFIPQTLPAALLEGFAWDAQGRVYQDLPALLDYAARVAGAVGAMMALVMGVRAPETIARACELGMAMQLSNIARDVGEDARNGRIYLPLDWLAEEGITPATFLANPVFDDRLRRVVARLLAEAQALYRQAAPGINALPRDCRTAIHAARRLYEAIGQQAGLPGFDPVVQRAVVPSGRKLALVARAVLDTALPAAAGAPVVPAAARYLIDACPAPASPRAPLWHQAESRAGWLISLMAQLEERQEAAGL